MFLAGLTDSESGPEFIASYKKVVVDLDHLLDVDFNVLCKEGISETTETLIEDVYSKLCAISTVSYTHLTLPTIYSV